MHPLHDSIAKHLAARLKTRKLVVLYDERAEFRPFVRELINAPRLSCEPVSVVVDGIHASLIEYRGSFLEVRAHVEPLASGDTPESIVIYVPGVPHDSRGSVLKELETAGDLWRPSLKREAREVLLGKYTQGVVDDILRAYRAVTYDDLANAAAANGGDEPPSVLKTLFPGVGNGSDLLTAWLADDANDEEVAEKEGINELCKLLKARLGIDVPSGTALAKLRAVALRFVLAGEFRLDLSCDAPPSLASIKRPASKEEATAVRQVARRLRSHHGSAYERLADGVQSELGIANAELPPGSLGSIDTFRFEERVLLRHAGELVASGRSDDALALVAAREHSFWLDRDLARKAQWEAVRRIAELGKAAAEIDASVRGLSGNVAEWLAAYTASGGWFTADQAQRRMETWLSKLDDEPDERALGIVRRAHEDLCQTMAIGFTKALAAAGWTIPGALHQTAIWGEFVATTPKPIAYLLVDSMRFEMGMELAERLPGSSEVSVRPAVAVLPTITPIGMAALMPGSSASFSVIDKKEKVGARIDDGFLPDLQSRKKFASARVPDLVDITLDELLGLQPSKLAKKLAGAQVVIVRSQEIDHAGESGFTLHARQVMDSVTDNLARALRRLAAAGIGNAVVTADHGHLFFPQEQGDSMRIDAPGGATVDLHRRCWIGRGGSTPLGCVRVAAFSLGYDSDLDFIFPAGVGVFKAGGDLAYHHGGPSLQELVVPVLSVRTVSPSAEPASPSGPPITVAIPDSVTNRIFSVTLTLGGKQMLIGANAIDVRPLLTAGGQQVGSVGMAIDTPFDRATGCVTLEPNKPATVVFQLGDENLTAIRVVVQDPTTDAELYRSPKDVPVRLLT